MINAIEKSKIEVLSDLDAISHRAASLFVGSSKKAITMRGRFGVAISGGSTPRRFYSLLGASPYCDQISWKRVHFFWADERCVPKDHEESNFRTAYDTLLSKISLPYENIHRIKGEEDPDKAAGDYEEEIRKFFGRSGLPTLDLVILGMGEDGHTASLFPGSKAVKETARFAVPVYLEKDRKNRVTLTLPVLNNSDQILFLVAGRSKAAVLSEILGKGDKKDQFPAGLINPFHGYMTWLIDQAAAEELKRIK